MYDNRSSRRFECQEIIDCYQDGHDFEAEILDVSWGGLRMACLADLELGSSVFLQHRNPDRDQFPIRARVCWKRPGVLSEFGLEFRESNSNLAHQWTQELFSESALFLQSPRQRRHEVRADVRLPIAIEDGHCEGQTLDLSLTGARFCMDRLVEDETTLYLCLPDSLIELQGQVLRAERQNDQWVHSVRFCAPYREDREQLSAFVQSVV